MRRRLERLRRGGLTCACFSVFSASRDTQDLQWSDERFATATLLLIRGASIEVASLMASSLILTKGNPEVRERILREAARQGFADRSANGSLAPWAPPYTAGVVRGKRMPAL